MNYDTELKSMLIFKNRLVDLGSKLYKLQINELHAFIYVGLTINGSKLYGLFVNSDRKLEILNSTQCPL